MDGRKSPRERGAASAAFQARQQAVLLCGTAPGGDHQRLLVHEVHIAEDGTDYTWADGVYRLSGAFATRQALRARSEELVYIAVHPHGGYDSVDFSGVDLRSQHNSTKPQMPKMQKDHLLHNSALRFLDGSHLFLFFHVRSFSRCVRLRFVRMNIHCR